jgi:hypothetical protein
MLAWRGRGREALLASLRHGGGAAPDEGRPVLDVPAAPLSDCLDDFWSASLSPARLRALPASPATAPDLLLRIFEPPAVRVRGKDLAVLLGPAYQRLAAGDELASGE